MDKQDGPAKTGTLQDLISYIKTDRVLLNLFYLLGFAICWALDFTLTTTALRIGLKPLQLVSLRFLAAVIFLLVFLADDRLLKVSFSFKTWSMLVLAGLTGVTATHGLQVVKRYSHLPSSTDIVFVTNLVPFFLLIAGFFILKEKVGWPKLCGALMGLTGMVLILANWERPSTFAPFVLRSFEESFFLLAALSWAVFTVIVKKIRCHTSLENTLALVMSIGTVPFLIAGLSAQGLSLFAINSNQWLVILLLGLISSACSYLLWFKALDFWDVSSAGSVFFLTPLIVTLVILVERAWLPLQPSPLIVPPVIAGSFMILAGVCLVLFLPLTVGKKPVLKVPTRWLTRNRLSRIVLVVLTVLTIAGLITAVVAMFSPAKTSLIKGILDNERPYHKHWMTRGYEMIPAYLLLLAGLTQLMLVRRLKRDPPSIMETMIWSGVSLLCLASFWAARGTNIVNWLVWMPPEVQYAIGTGYVSLQESYSLSWPVLVSYFSSLLFVLVTVIQSLSSLFSSSNSKSVNKNT